MLKTNKRVKDLTGKTFGRLKVVNLAGKVKYGYQWECLCECGNTVFAVSADLNKGNTSSCGCLRIDLKRARATTHGMHKIPEYKIWAALKTRCNNKNFKDYSAYGGRGITVCNRWSESFENFYADMGERPSPKHQIDRIDTNQGYSPSNCRWVEASVNVQNRRSSKIWIVDGKEYLSLTSAAKDHGVCTTTIQSWCDGMKVSNAPRKSRKPGCYSVMKYENSIVKSEKTPILRQFKIPMRQNRQ